MLVQFNEQWLNEWLNNTLINKRKNISKKLTLAGIEVEKVLPVSIFFKGIVIGEVINCKQHSYQSNLNITKINIGKEKKNINIIDNNFYNKKTKLVIAPVGALLPNGIKIKKSIICNKISEGISCSFDELLLYKKIKEKIILPDTAPVGADFYNYFNLKDFIYKINITPNRSDCLSILGIAREISIINNITLHWPKIKKIKNKIQDKLKININVKNKNISYLSRVIKNVNAKIKTPIWMSEKLRRCGVQPVSIIKDISHYISLEFGQPINFFDLDNINNCINIRMSEKGEKIQLSEKKNLILDNSTLVICDNNKIISIAGIISSDFAQTNLNTNNIFLECINFDSSIIIGKPNNYNLFTDNSYKYERGIDKKIQYKVMNRTTNLILEICGGQPGPISKNLTRSINRSNKKIFIRKNKIDCIIGCKLSEKNITNIFNKINFKILTYNRLGWLIKIPSWRFDINIEEDVIEEILRIYGYNKIPNITIKSKLTFNQDNKNNNFLKQAKHILINQGYQEIITYSFVDPEYQLLFYPHKSFLKLKNFISQDMSSMRLSMLSGLTKTAIYNQNRQKDKICIFESGICFTPDTNNNLKIKQELMLSALITGKRYNDFYWNNKTEYMNFYDIKGDLELIINNFYDLSDLKFTRNNDCYALHPGQSASIYLKNKKIGIIGALHPEISQKLSFKSKIFLFEISWDKIIKNYFHNNTIKEISQFPFNYRDISFFINKNISVKNILHECNSLILENNLNSFFKIFLLDVYFNKKIYDEKYKSVALRIKSQFFHKTVEDHEIYNVLKKIIKRLENCFSIILRNK